MAYVEVPSTDADLDSPAKEGALQQLRDNIDICRVQFFYLQWTNQTTTSTAYGGLTVKDFKIPIPEIVSSALVRQFICPVTIRNQTAGKTAYIRLWNVGRAVGSTQGSVIGTTYTRVFPVYALSASDPGTVIRFQLQMITESGGTAQVQQSCTVAPRLNWF
jgi:hypothetical protein